MAQLVHVAAPSTADPAGKGMITDDQHFLLTFIFGIYFGPHLKGEKPPHKSAMQRVANRLSWYTSDQLTGSKMMLAQMVHVYYYILRKASHSVVVAPSLLLEFFCNTLLAKVRNPGSNYPQFVDLFPIDLHHCSFVEERFMAINNVLFIDQPSTSYLREEVVARFKSLTGLQEFVLDKNAAKLPIYVTDHAFFELVAQDEHSGGRSCFSVPPHGSHKRKRMSNMALNVMPLRMVPDEGSPSLKSSRFSRKCNTNFTAQLDAKLVFFPLSKTETQCHGATTADSAGVRVVGNANMLTGSTTCCANLGESEDCYLFQVSLAGIRRDQTFSCEFDTDGEVLIEGEIATGGKMVESGTRNPYPPGHFSLYFHLPGRVDPMLSSCNFGSDGIFEGVVKKLIDNR